MAEKGMRSTGDEKELVGGHLGSVHVVYANNLEFCVVGS